MVATEFGCRLLSFRVFQWNVLYLKAFPVGCCTVFYRISCRGSHGHGTKELCDGKTEMGTFLSMSSDLDRGYPSRRSGHGDTVVSTLSVLCMCSIGRWFLCNCPVLLRKEDSIIGNLPDLDGTEHVTIALLGKYNKKRLGLEETLSG